MQHFIFVIHVVIHILSRDHTTSLPALHVSVYIWPIYVLYFAMFAGMKESNNQTKPSCIMGW